jgi:tRNA-dihydrouridine synthase 1
VQDDVDAVDLNLGCPQGIARKGHYGAFLQDEWDLIASIVRAGAAELTVPVWCKIRVFACRDKSVAYARMLEDAGCSLLAVHGRTRDQKGKFCPPADLATIRAIKRAVSIPVIANGNVLCREDAELALADTEAEAVLSAFGLLDNPALFVEPVPGARPPSRLALAREYLELAREHDTPMRMVRLHMFKFLRSRLDVNMDLNEQVAACKTIEEFEAISDVLSSRCDADGISFEERVEAGNTPTHVLCRKTVLRAEKAAAAREAQVTIAGSDTPRAPVKPAASGAYVARRVRLQHDV